VLCPGLNRILGTVYISWGHGISTLRFIV